MCGICGIVDNGPGLTNRGVLNQMTQAIAHRGPDDHGEYIDGGVGLGHRRLSILDLSSSGHQPMRDGSNILVFNGEIYNHLHLRAELKAAGLECQSRSDTEVLLLGYRLWGDQVVSKIKGMFAFALWDGRRRRLFCARDPFGKKPFYYCLKNGRFSFASEVESLVAGLDTRPDLDVEGLAHYLFKGYSATGKSIYRSIQTLGAGHCLEFGPEEGRLKEWPYKNIGFEMSESPVKSREGLVEEFQPLIAAAVKRRFESDVPVGILLSGGVDSSLVALLASDQSQTPISTFTVAFKGTPWDESAFAAQVASQAGSRHQEISLSLDSLPSLLDRLVQAYGEPFGDLSAIPTFVLFEGLKSYVKVVQTGDGGDEVFAGYKDSRLFYWRTAFASLMGVGDWMAPVWQDRLIRHPGRNFRQLGYVLKAWGADGGSLFNALYSEGWTQFWRKKLMRPEAWKLLGEGGVEEQNRRLFAGSGRSDFERYLNMNLERLTQGYLVKIDRASMAHSIEARSPMLDVDIFNKAGRLSPSDFLWMGRPKSILKQMLSARMGSSLAHRPKQGFTPPISLWLRDERTAKWALRLLTQPDSLVATLFPEESLRWLILDHGQGRDHAGRIWRLLFLNEWHRSIYLRTRQVEPAAV